MKNLKNNSIEKNADDTSRFEDYIKKLHSFKLDFAPSWMENIALNKKKTYLIGSLLTSMLGAAVSGILAYFCTKSDSVDKFSVDKLDKKVFISSVIGALAVLVGCFCYKKKVDDFQFCLEVGKAFI